MYPKGRHQRRFPVYILIWIYLLIVSFQSELLFEQIRFQNRIVQVTLIHRTLYLWNKENVSKNTYVEILRQKLCDTRVAGESSLIQHIRQADLTNTIILMVITVIVIIMIMIIIIILITISWRRRRLYLIVFNCILNCI